MGLLDRLFGRRNSAASSSSVGPPVFTVFDVETTGLSPRSDRIVELALVRADASGQIVDSWSSRFNPNRPVGATHIHGITDADVASAPRFHEQASVIVAALRGTTLVAHNASFDVAFLQRELGMAGWDLPSLPTYCTLKASTHYIPQLGRRRLAECCEAAGVQLHHAHSALGDATATAHLLHRYLTADHSARQRSPWSPLHAALAPPVHHSWPTHPSRAPRQPPPPSPSSSRRYAAPVKTRQITDALAASQGQVRISGDHNPETAAYAELLLSCLQDGELSAEERADLEQLTRGQSVSAEDIHHVHQALITGLAELVVDSGRVPRSERQELIKVAEQLGIDQKEVVKAFKQAEVRRVVRLSAATQPLPPGWSLGEPVRVGECVAFTGDAGNRNRQEADAARRGLRVTGSVSGLTDVLVWDGEMAGDKLRTARTHGTRIVSPSEFDVLLAHLQPSLDVPPSSPSPVSRPTTTASTPAQAATADESPAANPPLSAPRPADVREWALENGISVAERGRLSNSLAERYLAAQEEASAAAEQRGPSPTPQSSSSASARPTPLPRPTGARE